MGLFTELIVRTIRRQQRGEPIWTTAKGQRRKAKGINQNRKSPKFNWSSLPSAVNLVDEVRVDESAFIPKHVVNVQSLGRKSSMCIFA